MLRLPAFTVLQPTSVVEAVALLADLGPRAKLLAGGTDLLPSLKNELFAPEVVVSLARVDELRGIRVEEDGTLALGALTSLAEIAASGDLARRAPALAQAAGLVASPQIRRMGTLGGNVLLDTRCRYYNRSYFWRSALGFCLKKDGTECHVVPGASRCVAAASADTVPALATLDATLEIKGAAGRRRVPVEALFGSDGAASRLAPGEVLVSVRVPPVPSGHRGAYGKLRERGSVDFPLLGVAVRLDLDGKGRVERGDLVLTALAARPKRVARASVLVGTCPGSPEFADAVRDVAQAAHRQCPTLANVPGDPVWRREMVPVYVTRTLHAAGVGGGPVHHV